MLNLSTLKHSFYVRVLVTAGLYALCVSLSGCGQTTSGGALPKVTPTVIVAETVTKELADFVEFTGWTDAVESVEVRARVSGYLKEIPFKAGREVAVGDVLFQIDPRTYEAEKARCEGALATVQAQLKKFDAELDRQKVLREKGINSQSDLDQAIAAQGEAAASIQSAEANLSKAKLDLEFTKVTAPVAGRTSRERITVGNLVANDSTLLTTIVSLDPIYVYFDVDERTLLDIQRRIREKTMKSAREHEVEVRMELANETGFPHVGVIDLVDNRISATTGTIQVRCKFPNPTVHEARGETASGRQPAEGASNSESDNDDKTRLLTPGLFVRIQFQMGPPSQKVLVPDQALAQQQGQRYAFIVKSDNTVERRNVTIGRKDGSWRVVETGLQSGERVIVQGHLRVRPGMEVKAETLKEPSTPVAPSEHKATPEGEESKSKDH